MNAKEQTEAFIGLLKNICTDQHLSQSEKVKAIGHMFQKKIPDGVGYDDLHEIAKALSAVSSHLIANSNQFSRLFNSNPCCGAMNCLMKHYVRKIKREIENDFSEKNIALYSNEDTLLFNHRLIDAIHIHESAFKTMFTVNKKSFVELYAKHRQVPVSEQMAESQEKMTKVEDYERELREAWFGSGISTDSFKK